MQHILEAIEAGASGDELAALALPDHYRGAHVLKAEQEMWAGVAPTDKDPRKSLHVGDVPTPELAPDEAYVAVMAASINFNTVWTSIFEPVSARSVRWPASAGRASGARATTSPTRWSAATRPAWCCASARPCATGSRATG